ncbi:hypothetical protein RB195_011826 [Necator americanus]|uniref:Secreted protein n=1 Tax=Necator americanus TaxID=51031 RepID=A0ABR1D652_NECAM
MRGVRGAALIHTVVRPWLCGVVPACIGRYCSGHCPLLKHQVQVPYVTSCLYVLVGDECLTESEMRLVS